MKGLVQTIIEQVHPVYMGSETEELFHSYIEKELKKPVGSVDCELIAECVNYIGRINKEANIT